MRLKDKIGLITGAASGIGKACAERLAREGAAVMLTDIDSENGEAAAAAIRDAGGDARFQSCDVGDKAQVDAAVAATVAAMPADPPPTMQTSQVLLTVRSASNRNVLSLSIATPRPDFPATSCLRQRRGVDLG